MDSTSPYLASRFISAAFGLGFAYPGRARLQFSLGGPGRCVIPLSLGMYFISTSFFFRLSSLLSYRVLVLLLGNKQWASAFASFFVDIIWHESGSGLRAAV